MAANHTAAWSFSITPILRGGTGEVPRLCLNHAKRRHAVVKLNEFTLLENSGIAPMDLVVRFVRRQKPLDHVKECKIGRLLLLIVTSKVIVHQ